jgi:hypothetical protein
MQINEDKRIETVCKLHDDATQKAMRPDLVWEATNEDGKNCCQLTEITCPWSWMDHDGETLQKAYNKKVGKYDQSRREIGEAYPGRPVNQFTIVVSATGAFMKQSQLEFARATKLQGKQLARFSRDVVDAAIRGSFDIYTDSMSRIQSHREHKVEPEVKDPLEQEAVDCALEDGEEMERPEQREAESTV